MHHSKNQRIGHLSSFLLFFFLRHTLHIPFRVYFSLTHKTQAPDGSVNNRMPRGSACTCLSLTWGIFSYLSHFASHISQGLQGNIQALAIGIGNRKPPPLAITRDNSNVGLISNHDNSRINTAHIRWTRSCLWFTCHAGTSSYVVLCTQGCFT